MSVWILILLTIQFLTVFGLIFLWIKSHKRPYEDQRLTKGLQLLQSKISVIEDLSDRTETQVNQLVAMMENKIKEIQLKIIEADRTKFEIEASIKKSLEVSMIFQDKIPHQEIIDRQYTIKYVKAAKLSNQGYSVEEISQQVDLSPAEIELIFKLNREQLLFSEKNLPHWILTNQIVNPDSEPNERYHQQRENNDSLASQSQWQDFEKAFEVPKVDQFNLKRLGDEFKQAIVQNQAQTPVNKDVKKEIKNVLIQESNQESFNLDRKSAAGESRTSEAINQNGKKVEIKPYQFRKIEVQNDLVE